jgi:glyoxylase-like metal-dependent hydrolase (beta-lactamase superfamily II)
MISQFSPERSSSRSDVVRLRLPVPYRIGHVNGYLLIGDPLTLVDPGPRWPQTEQALESALSVHGIGLTDIELLVLTHHHDDHTGLAATVVRRAGCRVAAHELVAGLVEDVEATRAAEDRYEVALLRLHGAPAEVLDTVPAAAAGARAFADSVAVDQILRQGDGIQAGGRRYDIHLLPGHCADDTVFVDAWGAALIGDVALAHTPTPILAHRPPGPCTDPRERPRLLPLYRRSLERLEAMDLTLALPGHGPRIGRPTELVRRRMREHVDRAGALLNSMPDEPLTAWGLLARLRPLRRLDSARHPVSVPFVLMSRLLAQLDLLVEQGQVHEHDDGDVVRFAPIRG